MNSIVAYIWGALMFTVGTVGAAYFLRNLWRSDKHKDAKVEETLRTTAVFLIFLAGAGFGAYMGWESSYPTVVVNGYHRTTAPPGMATAILGFVYIPVLLAGFSFAAAWWMKKRRVRLAVNDDDLVWSALYAEYGWKEARRLYENYQRRQDPRSA
jgi:membrane protein DedA with SNARE-associated domain